MSVQRIGELSAHNPISKNLMNILQYVSECLPHIVLDKQDLFYCIVLYRLYTRILRVIRTFIT
jgi:hypothetical protein